MTNINLPQCTDASNKFQYHLTLGIMFFLNQSRSKTKKNSIVNWINNGVDFSPALSPCLKSECDMWRDGECIHIYKAGKPDHPHVLTR